MNRIAVLINRSSGPRDNAVAAEELPRLLAPHDLEVSAFIADCGRDLPSLLERAVDGPFDAIVACGGDGTVSTVAARLAGTDRPLGVAPGGTFNHFAKDLGLPLDLEGAAEVIGARHVRAVDVGRANDRLFLNNAQLGLYPTVMRSQHDARQRRDARIPALLRGAREALHRHPRMRVRVHVDGDDVIDRVASIVLVGNNRYHLEGLRLTRRERLDEGVLDLHLTQTTSARQVARAAVRALTGRLQDDPHYDEATASELVVEARRSRLRAALDGELVHLKTPLRLKADAGALRVLAPPRRAAA